MIPEENSIKMPVTKYLLLALLLAGVTVACRQGHPPAAEGSWLLVRGGTMVDVSDLGHSDADMADAFVLIHDDSIVETGHSEPVTPLPKKLQVINATGKYLLPGLTDGFGTLNNQAYANAYLYMGVTTLLEVDGGRRGDFFAEADPTPTIYHLEGIGEEAGTTQSFLARLDTLHEAGYKVVLLMYGLQPQQLDTLVRKAHALGMNCIGELGHTTYREAMAAGVETFVHFTRYSLELAPRDMAAAVADHPFSNNMDSPKWRYYRWLTTLDPADPRIREYGKVLAASHSFLQPTLSLLYLDLPEHKNPWDFPVAKILNPKDVNNPADKETGRHNYPPEIQKNYTALARQQMHIEPVYHAAGARYLAASASDVWGTMPGISLHTELELLHRIGLSNREALAAATSNFHKAYGWKTGLLKKGFNASLIILDENPVEELDNLQKIHTLILNGKVIEREKLMNFE